MTDKFDRYRLLLEIVKEPQKTGKTSDLIFQYANFRVSDVLAEKKQEYKKRNLLYWLKKYFKSTETKSLSELVLQEAAARIKRDINDIIWANKKIALCKNALSESSANDLDFITDLYRLHRRPPNT